MERNKLLLLIHILDIVVDNSINKRNEENLS